MQKPRVAPSILSADFGHLAREVAAVEQAGADWIHIDVMDGRFVPNITLGPVVVAALKKATALPLDVHLMILEPERYLEAFIGAGANAVTVQVEATVHLQRTIAEIKRLGAQAGVALNPATSHESLRYVIDEVDLVLCMSVNPGFGGQSFLPSSLHKVRAVASLAAEKKASPLLSVDGGVSEETAAPLARAGASVFVAGTSIFRAADYRMAIDAIRRAATLPSSSENAP